MVSRINKCQILFTCELFVTIDVFSFAFLHLVLKEIKMTRSFHLYVFDN